MDFPYVGAIGRYGGGDTADGRRTAKVRAAQKTYDCMKAFYSFGLLGNNGTTWNKYCGRSGYNQVIDPDITLLSNWWAYYTIENVAQYMFCDRARQLAQQFGKTGPVTVTGGVDAFSDTAGTEEYEQAIEPLGPLAPPAESRVVHLTLRRAASVAGRVLSSAGEAVAGARVSVTESGSPSAAYASTLSDEKGAFTMRVALSGDPVSRYVLEARHAEKGLARLEMTDAARPFTLHLSAGLYVDGAVRDERGAAVPFARVVAKQVEPRTRGSDALDVADAEGLFHIGPFEPGMVSVELQGAVLAAPSSRARAQVNLASGGGGSVNLVAPMRQSRVSGRVLDEHGEPMIGVTVLLAPDRFGSAARTEGTPTLTDARGSFDCDGLYAGPHRLFVESLGYASIERAVTAPGSLEIRLEPTSTALAQAPAPPSAPETDAEN